MTTSKAVAVWVDLNARQQLYLSTIFEFDQVAEADIKQASATWQKTPPASQWRQITYDIKVPREVVGYSSVQRVLRERGEHDPGSGSTLAALERRELVTVTHDMVRVPMLGMVPRIRVRLTTLGRAAARHGAGVTTPASPPKGLMARWSFNALARLYEAGQDGLVLHARGTPSWDTLLRLRDRRDGSFLDESGPRVRASPEARTHYEHHHACYRELYPDIDAPDPGPVPGAHAGLADHRVPRPRHLVRETDLRVLAELVELDAAGTCHLQRVVTLEYSRAGREAPAEVRAIPPGLLGWQVKDIARSEKPIDRLTAYPDGPLVEVIDAPNGPSHLDEHPTLPLVILTPLGREHYARHLDEYRRTYPDLALGLTSADRDG